MSFEQILAAGSNCLYNVFDLICLNVVCLLAIKMALHLIIINFEPYSNAGYTNQYLCLKGAWKEYLGIGQFGI